MIKTLFNHVPILTFTWMCRIYKHYQTRTDKRANRYTYMYSCLHVYIFPPFFFPWKRIELIDSFHSFTSVSLYLTCDSLNNAEVTQSGCESEGGHDGKFLTPLKPPLKNAANCTPYFCSVITGKIHAINSLCNIFSDILSRFIIEKKKL